MPGESPNGKALPDGRASVGSRLFRPWAAGFIVLAVSITLWGFGYKLSLYFFHSDPSSRVPAAKLWVKEHCTDSAERIKVKAESHSFIAPAALVVVLAPTPRPMWSVCRRLGHADKKLEVFRSQLPSRSPPSLRAAW